MERAIVNDNGIFILTHNKELFNKGGRDSWFVDYDVFDLVDAIVTSFDAEHLNSLKEVKDGCSVYWEENYHDKITDFILTMNPKLNRNMISNSLSAMEF